MSSRSVLAPLTVLALNLTPALATEFVLVRQKEPQAQIIFDEKDAPAPVRFAVQELQRYVQVMSGVTLPIVIPPARHRAGPGESFGFQIAHVEQENAGTNLAARRRENEDHYVLDVTDQGIAIAGAGPRAVLYATYDLLERLGCGWCVPGDDTIPRRSTVSIAPVKIDTAPTFKYRVMLDYPLMSIAQSVAILDWIAKNRLNWVHPCPNAFGEPKEWYDRRDRLVPEIRKRGLRVDIGGHTMHTWVSPDYFKEHPDWFSYNDGQRKPPTLCVTNTEMTAELVRNMRKFLDRCPEVDVVDIWHPDTEVYCHCPVCTKGLVPAEAKGKRPESTPADAVKSAHAISHIEFMNRVAAEIARSHPKVMISPLVYCATDRAMPDGCPAPADNLLLALAHIARDTYRPLAGEPKSAVNMRYLGNDLTWMAKAKNHYVYEYYNCWVAPFIYPGAQVIVQDLRILEQVGAQGSSSDMWGYTPCNMYVAARAMWSPGISWEAAVRDFHTRYYAHAGEEMAENEIRLAKSLYGMAGYGSGGALNPPERQADSGRLLNEIRPKQIAFLEALIARTDDPLIKVRLERALKPWKLWGADARWWAFPPFEDAK